MSDEVADPAQPESAAGWREVARVAFQHHLRGPWFVALLGTALLAPLVGLAFFAFGPTGLSIPPTRFIQPLLLLLPVFPVLLLFLVIPAYRGAWLRDPAAARERALGFFAGTWAAVALAFAAWVPVAALAISFHAPVAGALVAAAAGWLVAVAFSAVWIALALALAASFRREESRWVAAGVLWVLSDHIVPTLRMAVVSHLRAANGVLVLDPLPAWVLVLDALSPSQFAHVLPAGLAPGGPASWESYDLAPGILLALLALLVLAWIAVPLLLAIRAQSRGETTSPYPPLP